MSKVDLIYKLGYEQRSEYAEKGVPVEELAPILLSLGKLIQESNKSLNPTGESIAVNVKPFEEGSFVVTIVLFSGNIIQTTLNSLQNADGSHIKNVLEILGLITTVSGVSLLELIRFLKGKPTKIEPLAEGQVRYYAGDDNSITVNGDVHKLFANTYIKQEIQQVFVRPLEKDGYDSVESWIKGQKTETIQEIVKADLPALEEYVSSESIKKMEEEVTERRLENIYLKPKAGSFEGDPKGWAFHKGESEIIKPVIKDEEFLKQLQSGEIRPYGADLLTVDLIERQKRRGTELSTTYEIVKVHKYERSSVQMHAHLPYTHE